MLRAGAEHTINQRRTAPESKRFFYVHSFYGRVARKPKNSRKAKAQGRLIAVFKYLAAPLNRGRF